MDHDAPVTSSSQPEPLPEPPGSAAATDQQLAEGEPAPEPEAAEPIGSAAATDQQPADTGRKPSLDADARAEAGSPAPDAPGPRVGIVGLGTVGTAVAALLLDPAWRSAVAAKGHAVPRLVAVADLDLERDRGLAWPEDVRRTTDHGDVIAADDVDVLIELVGGSGVAADVVLEALAAGKPVVTANKDLVARRGRDLEAAVRDGGAALRFEAAVMSGVPVLGPLVHELGASRVQSLRGILNGTTNYILSTMASDARDYAEVLREAQARGYAEADPTSDVEGLDAAYKLTILARLAFGGWPDVDALRRHPPAVGGEAAPGITGIRRSHLSVAARLGLAIKLVARAERRLDDAIDAGVTPMAVAAGSAIGGTAGVTNLLEVTAQPVGRVHLSGPGAGGDATASAVLADVLALAEGAGSTWGQLPAGGELRVEDDLVGERGWLVVLEGLGAAGFPEQVRELALASTDEGFVSRPMSLTAMTGRLGLFDRTMAVYPILSDA